MHLSQNTWGKKGFVPTFNIIQIAYTSYSELSFSVSLATNLWLMVCFWGTWPKAWLFKTTGLLFFHANPISLAKAILSLQNERKEIYLYKLFLWRINYFLVFAVAAAFFSMHRFFHKAKQHWYLPHFNFSFALMWIWLQVIFSGRESTVLPFSKS